jgi:hypothetical protein
LNLLHASYLAVWKVKKQIENRMHWKDLNDLLWAMIMTEIAQCTFFESTVFYLWIIVAMHWCCTLQIDCVFQTHEIFFSLK